MAVPIQISLPSGEVVEVVEEQNQLALIQSDFEVSSVAQMERDVVVVEDWASDTLSEEAGLLNEECFSPLAQELKGLFSLINYSSTSVRRKGIIRDRALLVSQ